MQRDDGIAYLSFFVEEKEDGTMELLGESVDTDTVVARMQAELEDLKSFLNIGEGSIMVSETEDIDWINNWKKYFHQFYIDDLLVIPSWEEVKPEDKDKKILHIDPGTAFEQVCMRQHSCVFVSSRSILHLKRNFWM